MDRLLSGFSLIFISEINENWGFILMEGFYELKHSFSIFYCGEALGNSKLHLCEDALNKRAWDIGALFSQQRRFTIQIQPIHINN